MGNVILIQWCNARIGNVLSLVSFLFSSLHPKCFRIKFLLLVGTVGASANIAVAGMKGLVEKELPWVFWMWCLAHRLELAVQDALKHTTFDRIEEMLLRLYYLYE